MGGDGGAAGLGCPFTPCPVVDPANLDVLLDLAARRYEVEDYETSLACAELAARVSPRSVEAHDGRGAALAALGRLEEARSGYTLALAIDPDDARTLADAADLYVNRVEPAREASLIGLEYARRGSARVDRRRDARPLASRLALLEAQALDDLGVSDESLARADAALDLDPGNREARYQRGVALFHLGRFDLARRTLEEVLAAEPDDAFAHQQLGLVLERQGRLAAAEVHFTRAQALAPGEILPPVLVPPEEFRGIVKTAVAELGPDVRGLLAGVPVDIEDLPASADLNAVTPPFSPTILGLCRGAPIGGEAAEDPGPRSIVLYRKNLARAVTTRGELERQVRMTLWHELGHLRGEDEDDLRLRGLE